MTSGSVTDSVFRVFFRVSNDAKGAHHVLGECLRHPLSRTCYRQSRYQTSWTPFDRGNAPIGGVRNDPESLSRGTSIRLFCFPRPFAPGLLSGLGGCHNTDEHVLRKLIGRLCHSAAALYPSVPYSALTNGTNTTIFANVTAPAPAFIADGAQCTGDATSDTVVHSLSPSLIGARYGYILSPSVIGARYG